MAKLHMFVVILRRISNMFFRIFFKSNIFQLARNLLTHLVEGVESVMPNKKLIDELRELLRQRGIVTRVQREYAKVEEKTMMLMYPITKPAEEKRYSHLRTLERYISDPLFLTSNISYRS